MMISKKSKLKPSNQISSSLSSEQLSFSSSFSLLPSKPGVYWFQNQKNEIIYIGKAKNLKNRLLSYKRLVGQSPKTKKLISLIKTVNYLSLETEFDAIITEAQLIRLYQPVYNILLKDDKSPLYIVFTKETYPRIIVTRKAIIQKNQLAYKYIHGPYLSGLEIKSLLKYIRKIFPYCTKKQSKSSNNLKPCFYYHLHLCPGACNHTISISDYQANIYQIHQLLSGHRFHLLQTLKQEINLLSQEAKFELADIKKAQYLLLANGVKNYHSKNFELPITNLTKDVNQSRLTDLVNVLKTFFSIPDMSYIRRIEGYDISNIQGKNATASMVVFTQGQKDLTEYRRFRIKTLDQPNDPKMLKEALQRRFNHTEWTFPQVILIDGGKQQLRSALNLIPPSIFVISLVKNPDRVMIFDKYRNIFHTIKLDLSQPYAQLLTNIRDESHRFAKKYQSILHVKNLIES